MPDKPRRRWFAFKLRTLLVGVFLVSLPLAWVAYSLNWIRQREEFMRAADVAELIVLVCEGPEPEENRAPGLLGLLGERPRDGIALKHPAKLEEAKRLFPEAEVSVDPIAVP